MKNTFKISIGVLLAFVLLLAAPILGIAGSPEIVMAATSSEPKTTVSKLTLYVGYKTYQIKFDNLSKNATVTFKSSNTKAATVSKTGVITPVAKGSATVTVTMKQNKKTYTSKIKVTVDVPNIKFSSQTKELKVGEVYTFKATAKGTSSDVVWSVSDKTIGKIDSKSGKFTALKAGKVDVIATAGKITNKCTVNVSNGKFSTATTEITLYEQEIIYINTKGMDVDEEIIFNVDDTDVLECAWGEWEEDDIALLLDPIDVGTTTVTISSSKTSDQLVIKINVIEAPEERDPNAKELTAKEIYNKCAPATVELQVTTPYGEYVGSGFFIYSGVLITNYHVIEDATKIVVITNKGIKYEVDYIFAYDKKYDIAVLTIDAVTEHLTLNQGDISVGETVYALGSPQGLTGSLSDGIVSSASRISEGVEYIQVTAPISGGNSGGPLINAYGEVIGINTFILLDSQNLNFAVNVYQYLELDFSSPMKAADYYEESKNNSTSNSTTGEMYEDEAKSGDTDTAQFVPNDTLVYGSLENSNVIDGYRFTLTQSGKVTAVCMTKNNEDAELTYFTIIDKDFNIIADSELLTDTDGTKYLGINETLNAGDYWIVVFKPDANTNITIDYFFLMYY